MPPVVAPGAVVEAAVDAVLSAPPGLAAGCGEHAVTMLDVAKARAIMPDARMI
jgi:hypothetical protein